MLGTDTRTVEKGMDRPGMRCGTYTRTLLCIAFLLSFPHISYANGDDAHLGGVFFVLLGGVIFLGSLILIFYYLLRDNSSESNEDCNHE